MSEEEIQGVIEDEIEYEGAITYDCYLNQAECFDGEIYEEFITQTGETVVSFGYYGHD